MCEGLGLFDLNPLAAGMKSCEESLPEDMK
jgi:hypothetical protein